MKVDAAGASGLFQPSNSQNQAHQVRDVFSELLEAAGRQGYASAQAVESDQPVDEQIQTTWTNWFDVERISGRYQGEKDAETLRQDYGNLLVRAHAEDGYVRPQDFLNSLSKDDLETVQTIHRLANPINVNGLTEEGSLNLLLPPPAQVDLNHDGLTRSGLAYGLRFPDSTTPAEVTTAWEEVTAGMPLGERMTYELQMKLPVLFANFYVDENGAYSHHFEPGDPEFRNPMADPEYSYFQATQDQLNGLEFSKNLIPQDEYERRTEFWTRFQGLLEE